MSGTIETDNKGEHMKRLIAVLALTIGLALTVTADPTPVHADTTHTQVADHPTTPAAGTRALHNFDNYSLWSCAYTRPNSAYSIDHSWAAALYPNVVIYDCQAHRTDTGRQACWQAYRQVDPPYIARSSSIYYDTCPFTEP